MDYTRRIAEGDAHLERVAVRTAAAREARAEEQLEQEERVQSVWDELQQPGWREPRPRSVELAGGRVGRVEQQRGAEEGERAGGGIQVERGGTDAVGGGRWLIKRHVRAHSEIQVDWIDQWGSINARNPWPC